MKKKVSISIILVIFFISPFIQPGSSDCSVQVGVSERKTYTFTYKIIPRNATVPVQRVVDLPCAVKSVLQVNNDTCNVSYDVSYTVIEDDVPVKKVDTVSILISQTMNLTSLVTAATNPWDFMFIYSLTDTEDSSIRVNIDDSSLGIGFVSWDVNGILLLAQFNTTLSMNLDGITKPVLVTIEMAPKPPRTIPSAPTGLLILMCFLGVGMIYFLTRKKILNV